MHKSKVINGMEKILHNQTEKYHHDSSKSKIKGKVN